MNQNKKSSILVVDDEVDICDLLKEELEDEGYNVYATSTVDQALDIVHQNSVDLILSDLTMPKRDGFDLAKTLKEENENGPKLIFMTGDLHNSVAEVYKAGVEALVRKPFEFDELKNLIETTLENRSWVERSRIKIDLPVKLLCKMDNLLTAARVKNISAGGAFCEIIDHVLKTGDVVEFRIPKPVNIEATGTIRWAKEFSDSDNPQGVGIQFSQISEDSEERLFKLINRVKTGKETYENQEK